MSGDTLAAWRQFQLRAGEQALAMRHQGADWRTIADALHVGDIPTVQRCAALALSAELAARRTAQDRAGDAQPQAGASGSPAPERAAGAAR